MGDTITQNGLLKGSIKAVGNLTGKIKSKGVLKGTICKPHMVASESGNFPTYEGDFLVIPSADDKKILETAGKYVESNITVDKIPYSEVSNTAGGTTVIIG